MRKVFSSNETSETILIRDALVQRGFEATIQNQHSGRSAVPGFRAPAEIWISQNDDYERARQIVTEVIATLDSKFEGEPWACTGCREENPASFEMCWKCGQDRSRGAD